jgi:gamma-D-glutamyl-L-lysine dipeptidyl-peptidase
LLYIRRMRKDNKIYAYASSGIVPVRNSASETAEMVTQLLLGETMQILKSEDRWHFIKSDYDQYEGWVSITQITAISESDYVAWSNHPERKRSPFFTYRIHRGQKTYLTVPSGAPVVYTGFEVELPDGPWNVASEPVQLKEHAIIDTALKLLGVPYLWGGRTDSGIDCSGFVQLVYGLHRYDLPRDASQQHDFAPIKAKSIDKAEYSDIVYFSSNGKTITHTGFYIGEGHLLHASGNVQINCIDPRKRNVSRFVFNERLANTIVGIQTSASIKAAATVSNLERA